MSTGVESIKIKVLVANKTDVTLKNEPHFKDKVYQPGPRAMECLAEHGLAFSLDLLVDGKNHHYLFDMGGLKQTLLNNLKVFKIDHSKFEKIFLSHGHYDHWGAVIPLSRLLDNRTEYILNPEGLLPRFSLGKELTGTKIDLENLNFQKLITEKKIRELPNFPEQHFQEIAKQKNFVLNFTSKPVQVQPGVQTSGEITIYDPDEVTRGMLIKKDEKFYYDTFRDELSLYINVMDKGLVVLTGCGHCGLINTIKHGQALTGVKKIYAVIGGLHQNWASPSRIQKTLKILQDMDPELICGLHCTGFKFVSQCVQQMPLKTALAVVGTTFIL